MPPRGGGTRRCRGGRQLTPHPHPGALGFQSRSSPKTRLRSGPGGAQNPASQGPGSPTRRKEGRVLEVVKSGSHWTLPASWASAVSKPPSEPVLNFCPEPAQRLRIPYSLTRGPWRPGRPRLLLLGQPHSLVLRPQAGQRVLLQHLAPLHPAVAHDLGGAVIQGAREAGSGAIIIYGSPDRAPWAAREEKRTVSGENPRSLPLLPTPAPQRERSQGWHPERRTAWGSWKALPSGSAAGFCQELS